MEHEIQMREDRREYRHRRSGGAKSWWESEDLPRIEELRSLLGTRGDSPAPQVAGTHHPVPFVSGC